MARKKKRKRRQEGGRGGGDSEQKTSSNVDKDDNHQPTPSKKHESGPPPNGGSTSASGIEVSNNPLLEKQAGFLKRLSSIERDGFFCDTSITPKRRATIWMEQAEIGEKLINQYSWSTPDIRALHVLNQFAPIVEIGCGKNAYWCKQLLSRYPHLDVIGIDVNPNSGGIIPITTTTTNTATTTTNNNTPSSSLSHSDFRVQHGDPSDLHRHAHRTLFLCYPDENIMEGQQDARNKTGNRDDKKKEHTNHDDDDDNPSYPYQFSQSMAWHCLDNYTGDHVVHVGELGCGGGGTYTYSQDQAPWGRSSSADFQVRLATEFHCILRIGLSNWLHTVDCMTVWKRSKQQITMVFEADDGENGSADEEAVYRHIPFEERLPLDTAAPCCQHLLDFPKDTEPYVGTTKEAETEGVPSMPQSGTEADDDRKDKNKRSNKTESSLEADLTPASKASTSRRSDDDKPKRDSSSSKKKRRKKEKESIMHSTDDSKQQQANYECPW